MREYTHYGVRTTKQILNNKRYVHILEENNVDYEVMPIDIPCSDGEEVYIYFTPDKTEKRYAFVVGINGGDAFGEKIYITNAIPDDLDWWALAEDIDQQETGGEPLKMPTQFKRRLSAAEKAVDEQHKKEWDEFLNVEKFFDCAGKTLEDIIPNYWREVAHELRHYYTYNELQKYGYAAWDVDDDLVKKILKPLDAIYTQK